MPNITLSIDEKLLKQGRKYAEDHETSLNALIRDTLAKTVQKDATSWLDECFAHMDSMKLSSRGRTWKRSDLYDA
jgi:hypothetical protein